MSTLKTVSLQHLNATGPALNFDASGNVGIGIVSPGINAGGRVLHLHNPGIDAASNSNIALRITNGTTGSNDTDGLIFARMADGVNYVGSYEAENLQLVTNSLSRMIIDSSGRVTRPYQPMVYAIRDTGGWNDLYPNAVIVFNNAPINNGSHYNTSTGTFTCPIAGYYRVQASLLVGNVAVSTTMYLLKNGSQYAAAAYQYPQSTAVNTTTTMMWTVLCAANDTLKVSLAQSGSGGAVYLQAYNSLNIELMN